LPIEKSKRMLILTSARLENQGLKWNDAKTTLVSAGGTKALCEPVEGDITFKTANSDSITVYMLNQTGIRVDSLLVNQTGESVQFTLNKNTLWYEISNHQFHDIPQGNNIQFKDSKNSLKVYPNPGSGSCTLEFISDESVAEFVLYNSTGKLIQNEKLKIVQSQLNNKQLDLKGLSNGIYFCGFQFDNGKKMLNKLVVNN
jgi:hypothetical protein